MKLDLAYRLRILGVLCFIALFGAGEALAQTPIPIGPQTATYNDTRVRGYFFTATSSWQLCGLYIPTDNSTGPMNVEFVRFTQGPPPAWNATTNNFTSLFYSANVAGTAMIPVPNIQVNNASIYGTYGARSQVGVPTTMRNSYGAAGTVTNVNGVNMTLSRSGMQFPLNNQQMHDIWAEVNGPIGRVIMYHGCCPTPPAPVMTQAPQQICASDTFTYEVNTGVWGAWSIQNINWNPGVNGTIVGSNLDSSIVQIVFAPGAFQDTICVTLTDTCNTGPETCIPVTVNPLFADAGNDTSICVPTMTMNANAGLGNWTVAQGSGTFSSLNDPYAVVSGMTPGMVNTFVWTLTNANCPQVSDEINITVNPIPVAQFSGSDGCEGEAISFSSQSYALGGGIVDWDWDMNGDGVTDYSTSQFTHAFNTDGLKQCTLIVTANQGCTDTIIQSFQIHPNPVTQWTYTPDCEGSPMAFTDGSSITAGAITSWNWDFGDGGAAASQNPAHIYPEDSVYTATLTAISDQGCTDTKSAVVTVFTIPEVDFTITDKCWNEEVFVTDLSTSVQGDINYWEWDFGDGSNPVIAQDTIHQYGAAPNIYDVRLLVATDSGCTNTVIKPVNIYPVPVPGFTTTGVCQDARIEFKDASILDTIFGSYLVEWNYDFGDSTTENTASPGHFYSTPGYFDVIYTPRTNYGCEQSGTQEVLIRPRPQANIVILDDEVCAGNMVNFMDQSYFDYTYDSAGIDEYLWSFGTGGQSVKQHPSYTYVKGGEYEVGLKVETTFGCTDSAFQMAEIYHVPVATFSIDSNEGCSPYCVVFRDNSSVLTNDDLMYDWSFGNNQRSRNVNPTHCFALDDGADSESYIPALKVTTPDGCVDSVRGQHIITVHSNPNANFILSDSAIDLLDPEIYIDNLTVGGLFWNWDFGDGEVNSSRDPYNHTFKADGMYTISLTSSSLFGCTDHISKQVFVESHQTIFIPGGFSPNGDGVNDYISIYGEDLEEVEIWIYDRWGHEVFHGIGTEVAWDGKTGTQVSPIGTYGYVLKYRHRNQVRQTQKGTFVITNTNSKK